MASERQSPDLNPKGPDHSWCSPHYSMLVSAGEGGGRCQLHFWTRCLSSMYIFNRYLGKSEGGKRVGEGNLEALCKFCNDQWNRWSEPSIPDYLSLWTGTCPSWGVIMFVWRAHAAVLKGFANRRKLLFSPVSSISAAKRPMNGLWVQNSKHVNHFYNVTFSPSTRGGSTMLP